MSGCYFCVSWVIVLFVCLFIFCLLRQGPGRPWTRGDPASASPVLELQMCDTRPSFQDISPKQWTVTSSAWKAPPRGCGNGWHSWQLGASSWVLPPPSRSIPVPDVTRSGRPHQAGSQGISRQDCPAQDSGAPGRLGGGNRGSAGVCVPRQDFRVPAIPVEESRH